MLRAFWVWRASSCSACSCNEKGAQTYLWEGEEYNKVHKSTRPLSHFNTAMRVLKCKRRKHEKLHYPFETLGPPILFIRPNLSN
eukprot:1157975-Pelagomonas_calceolata.AAC.9